MRGGVTCAGKAMLALLWAAPLHGGPLVINEFVASNHGGLMDAHGDTPDWIELHNPGEETIELAGWGLSDDEGNPRRWVFEQGTVEPGGFFVVFASGKDRQAAFHPHTNFAISSAGEPLLLTDPGGDVVDFVPETPLPVNISFGRKPDGSESWRYFAEPTPGTENTSTGYLEVLHPPTFSHEAGFHTEPFALTLETDHEAASIIYTLDGSEPNPDAIGGSVYTYKENYPEEPGAPFGERLKRSYESHAYDGTPVPVTDRSGEPDRLTDVNTTWRQDTSRFAPEGPVFKGTVVRARAIREGAIPSRVVTRSYFVTPEGRDRYSLPVFSLSVQEDGLFDYDVGIHVAGRVFDIWRQRNPESTPQAGTNANYRNRGFGWERPGHVEFFLDQPHPTFKQGIGVRVHGGWTRHYPLKSLRLYARNSYDDTNAFEHPFFADLLDSADGRPVTEFRRLILRNAGNDYPGAMLRDAFLQALVRPLGLDDQRYLPSAVFLNGEFWGLMNLRERIDHHYLARRHKLDAEDVALLNNYGDVRAGEARHRTEFIELRDYIREHDMTETEHYEYVADRMDIENFIRYNAFQIYIRNVDWPGNNRDYWRKIEPDRSDGAPATHDGRWRWIVVDLDAGFGPWGSGARDVTHDTLSFATEAGNTSHPNPDWATLKLRRLLENESFRHRFINATADQMNTIFRPENFNPLLDKKKARIEPILDEHRARWRDSARRSVQELRDFGAERPQWIQSHTVDYFGLPGTSEVTLDTPAPRRGVIRINQVHIAPGLEGLADPGVPFPWTGTYFQQVPVEIEAIPKAGFIFSHWEGGLEGSPAAVTLAPPEELSATAVFVQDPEYKWDEVLPQPHRLAGGPYILEAWPRDADAGSYPPNMVFPQTPIGDPLLEDPAPERWAHPYDLTSRSRVTGRGPQGIAFINTSNPQEDGGGYVTGAELALDTRGVSAATVSFTAGTVLPNDRTYALRLQYRIGPEGTFRDLHNSNGGVVEYVRHEMTGHEQDFAPIPLPEEAMDQPHLTLRWRYHYIETGVSGPRAKLALRDIRIEGTPEEGPTWTFR